ncbi:hypothetical protein Pint_28859 [Pistacia integerrima]|uniref:Uncharacterized protein n=1 Tax=Pistacia integerrima TaxID=434235 RepID=A0ACC0WYI1_9ROSI|nr:hypothetical protein Pint_28859 [Pistacia integerrima]
MNTAAATTRELKIESNQKDETSNSTGQFSYSEILRITNNFERAVGKGGFGTVYHGYLGDTEVAVKMLSQSSVHGYKEFQAEAKTLMRTHHKNLTSLVGYCNEGTNLGLIFEYMGNGNLEKILSERNPNFLSWEERLRIALDTAQAKGDIKNIVDPRLQEDYGMNSLWKVVELAMACVSPASTERPNMSHVVMELNQCLKMEMARKNDRVETESEDVVKVVGHECKSWIEGPRAR